MAIDISPDKEATFKSLSALAFGSINTSSFTSVGTPNPGTAILQLVNRTDVDLLVSLDGTASHIYMFAGSKEYIDLTASKRKISLSTSVYVKGLSGGSAPSTGSFYLGGIS